MELHQAACRGDVETIRRELDRGAPVNGRDKEGRTALSIAAGSKGASLETLQLLIDHGAKVDVAGALLTGSPMTEAARSGRVEFVQCLLAANNRAEPRGSLDTSEVVNLPVFKTPQHNEILEILLDAGASLDAASRWNESPLRSALRRGNLEALRMLLARGVDKSGAEMTAGMWAALLGSLEELETDFQIGTDLAARDTWHRPILFHAVLSGDTTKVEFLLEKGASLTDIGNCGETVLQAAVHGGNETMLSWLVRRGAQVSACDEFGNSALKEAVCWGETRLAEVLLDAGAELFYVPEDGALGEQHDDQEAPEELMAQMKDLVDQVAEQTGFELPSPDSQSDRGESDQGPPVFERVQIITESPHIEMVRLLVAHGGNIDAVDDCGYWLLKSAAEVGNLQFARDLLAEGAQVDTTSADGTALHTAINWGHLEIARLLLDAGADPNAEDVDGDRPLDFARSLAAEELLQRAGGDSNPYSLRHEKGDPGL